MKMTITKKLLSGFLSVALILAVISSIAFVYTKSLVSSYSNLITHHVKVLQNADQIQYLTGHQVSLLREYFVVKAPDDQSSIVADNQSIQALVQQTLPLTQAAHTQQNFNAVLQMDNDFVQKAIAIFSLSKTTSMQAALKQALSTALFDYGVNMRNIAQQEVDAESKQLAAATAANQALAGTATTIELVLSIIGVVLAIALGIIIARIIVRPLRTMVDLFEKVSRGDLRETANIRSRDEIGQLGTSVNAMIERLRGIMAGVMNAADNVSAASQEISAATEQVAGGSNAQASASETVSEVFRELSFAITAVAQNAEQAAEWSGRTTSLANEGQKIVQASVDGMNVVSEHMDRLNDDSNRVGQIVEVIDDIADQTNLLALNAAIEAARAGDQGRGFAVVADEVRKLAERTSEATKQIATIIKTMQENTRSSVQAVEQGKTLSEQSGEAFTDIVSMVNQSALKVSEIAAASEEQSAQSNEVLVSIESIAAAAEEAAASSEETASSSQSLARLAEELAGYVSVFKLS